MCLNILISVYAQIFTVFADTGQDPKKWERAQSPRATRAESLYHVVFVSIRMYLVLTGACVWVLPTWGMVIFRQFVAVCSGFVGVIRSLLKLRHAAFLVCSVESVKGRDLHAQGSLRLCCYALHKNTVI